MRDRMRALNLMLRLQSHRRPYDGPVSGAGTRDPLDRTLLDGRYLVQAKIASSGTSTVYRGLDTRLDRPVALKVMDSRYAGDEQFLTRFQLEARTVARLKNPGLVAVYDQGTDAQHPFLVMELIEGGTLRELLAERGPMPPHAVVAVLRPVLGGLAAAHLAGLVHRDVKPENVLISDDGDVKIADFGLVRAVAAAGITSASVILGTVAYLSPEQVRSGSTSPRSDVYSVGILTYELLTGRTPFTGDSPLSIAYQRLDTDVPRASAAIDGVPPQFDQLVARAAARDPADRPAIEVKRGVLEPVGAHVTVGVAEHGSVKGLVALVVPAHVLAPDERAWLVRAPHAGVRACLPDTEGRAAGVRRDEHPPDVHDIHRVHHDLAACRLDLCRGLVRVRAHPFVCR